jgi:hypothetical protein
MAAFDGCSPERCILSIGHIIQCFRLKCQKDYVLRAEYDIMEAWHGRLCGSPCATFAGTGGYPKRRTHQIALAKSAAQPCGTRAALTAGRGKHGSRLDAATGRERVRAGLQNPISCTGGRDKVHEVSARTGASSDSILGQYARNDCPFGVYQKPFSAR